MRATRVPLRNTDLAVFRQAHQSQESPSPPQKLSIFRWAPHDTSAVTPQEEDLGGCSHSLISGPKTLPVFLLPPFLLGSLVPVCTS